MEKWRKVYFKKLKTKAFSKVNFGPTFQAVLEDENKSHKTIDKSTVANQIVWHWERINDRGDMLSVDIKNKDKYNFKSVANNILKKYFTKDDFDDFYLSLRVKIIDNLVQLK